MNDIPDSPEPNGAPQQAPKKTRRTSRRRSDAFLERLTDAVLSVVQGDTSAPLPQSSGDDLHEAGHD